MRRKMKAAGRGIHLPTTTSEKHRPGTTGQTRAEAETTFDAVGTRAATTLILYVSMTTERQPLSRLRVRE